MKLPAKLEYSLKAVLELARNYSGGGVVRLNEIAQKQGIPSKFLLQLMIRLKGADIVKSSRGVSGGYYLARDPRNISVKDVVSAMDDTITWRSPKNVTLQNKTDKMLYTIWNEMNNKIAEHLSAINIEELAGRMSEPDTISYSI